MPQPVTAGSILVDEALPAFARGKGLVLDKKAITDVLREVARNSPDDYSKVVKRLADVGREVSSRTGRYSIGLSDMRKSDATRKAISTLREEVSGILADRTLTPADRNDAVIAAAGRLQRTLPDSVYKESLAAGNPIALQVASGARGNKMNVASLLGGDLLYEDHKGRVVPIPITRSFSEGLSPEEYVAGSYGARKSVIDVKQGTANAGYFSKLLAQVQHRLMVTADDDLDGQDAANPRGFPVDTSDQDSEGSLLARDVGPYKRNTVLTPKILADLDAKGHKRILVRSPAVGGSVEGGVYGRDVGVRERGRIPIKGEFVGQTAAQSLGEPIAQGTLGAKHGGGVAGATRAVSGFKYLEQLVQASKTFKGGAAHAQRDGRVDGVAPAPAGGTFITIDGERHHAPIGAEVLVKAGDTVEAGDVLTDGVPNHNDVIKHKHIGEGRRYFIDSFGKGYKGAGLVFNRRNAELAARGLVNHVKLTDEYGDYVPDDILPYSTLEKLYSPREDHKTLPTRLAVGKYLERPVLHHTIGTRIKPSMMKDFEQFGVANVAVHDEPPPFQPLMVRASDNLANDPDWMTRLYGSGLKSSLLDATARGATADEGGTSFVAGLAKRTDFGRKGIIQPIKTPAMPKLGAGGPFNLDSSGNSPYASPQQSTAPKPPTAQPPVAKAPATSSGVQGMFDSAGKAVQTAANASRPQSPFPDLPEPQAPQASHPRQTQTMFRPGMDDPQQFAQYVGANNPNSFGGQFGAATRFFSGVGDPADFGTLTGAPGEYQPTFDWLHGPKPQATRPGPGLERYYDQNPQPAATPQPAPAPQAQQTAFNMTPGVLPGQAGQGFTPELLSHLGATPDGAQFRAVRAQYGPEVTDEQVRDAVVRNARLSMAAGRGGFQPGDPRYDAAAAKMQASPDWQRFLASDQARHAQETAAAGSPVPYSPPPVDPDLVNRHLVESGQLNPAIVSDYDLLQQSRAETPSWARRNLGENMTNTLLTAGNAASLFAKRTPVGAISDVATDIGANPFSANFGHTVSDEEVQLRNRERLNSVQGPWSFAKYLAGNATPSRALDLGNSVMHAGDERTNAIAEAEKLAPQQQAVDAKAVARMFSEANRNPAGASPAARADAAAAIDRTLKARGLSPADAPIVEKELLSAGQAASKEQFRKDLAKRIQAAGDWDKVGPLLPNEAAELYRKQDELGNPVAFPSWLVPRSAFSAQAAVDNAPSMYKADPTTHYRSQRELLASQAKALPSDIAAMERTKLSLPPELRQGLDMELEHAKKELARITAAAQAMDQGGLSAFPDWRAMPKAYRQLGTAGGGVTPGG